MERRQLQSETEQMDPAGVGGGSPDGPALSLSSEDREWIDRIRGGNSSALEALFKTHARPLTAFAYRYVQSYDPSMRVVHEVFARLWKGRHSWAFHGTVRGNLFASAHRVALEELRRTRTEARWHAGLPMTPEPGVDLGDPLAPADTPCEGDLHERIQSAIARLPARARTVGYMRWADRLSRAEIATVLGSNVRTVHTQLTPASRAMRKRLARAPDDLVLRTSASTLREAAERVDPFTSIDPDRIEYFLAAECIPSEEAQLRRDVAAAGGEPEALDAMESAWCGPGRIMEDLVDVDAAWHSLARRLTLPQAEPLPAGPTSPGVRARSLVRSARVSIAPVFARAGRGIREGSQRTADLVVHAAAVARPRVRSAYAWTRHAASVCAAATARQLAAARDAAVAHRHVLRSGLVRRIGALLGLALVVGGVWAFVAHRPRTTPALAHHATTKPLSPHARATPAVPRPPATAPRKRHHRRRGPRAGRAGAARP